ncbi:hypothetical protein [Acidithiobacillus sp.]|uniref:hypothetical protein n=1 Tax=Acidithiobacillus sp. TaxID=1872118 RepID=UPI00262BF66C|nr:hypothetical protein [Acidithiobacillus sp.]MDD2749378.1 hypothetical protein [Acidithiobacillus sp.]MDD5280752.1 hypothetical protein [Acidithiobacillus sp.]
MAEDKTIFGVGWHKLAKSTLADYLEWFEDAFILFTVRIFDASLARMNTNSKKIYCVDHALVTSISSGILPTRGIGWKTWWLPRCDG